MPRYFILYKPYGVLSQFTREAPHHRTLADLYDFPPGVYPVGRLDRDSEGLLLLTDDKKLNHQLLDPAFQHVRSYLVQVEGEPTEAALGELRKGVSIRISQKAYTTLPAKVRRLGQPPALPDRDPPIRFRKSIPDSWLELELQEGKNRQVRRMLAKVGFPVLRLARNKIEGIQIRGLKAGEAKELDQHTIYTLLKLKQ